MASEAGASSTPPPPVAAPGAGHGSGYVPVVPASIIDPSTIDFDARFKIDVTVVALTVPAREVGGLTALVRDHLFKSGRAIKAVIPDPTDASRKVVTLNPATVTGEDLAGLPEAVKEGVQRIVSGCGGSITTMTRTLTYESMSTDQVLQALLPAGVEVPASFEMAGSVAHMNLRDEILAYKRVIGKVIVDKNPTVRTVVNKVGAIESEFRTCPLEVIAGDGNLNVEVHEGGATFRFNFAEVYWNSRLQMEHTRMSSSFKPSEVICDMFCGIGPFAIPAAARGCVVHANDLNPKSYEYLVANVKLNKVDRKVTCYNMDARAFLRDLAGRGIQFHHALMNLPATAIEFLDCFVGAFGPAWTHPMPTIHTYCFSPGKDDAACFEDVIARVTKVLGLSEPPAGITVRTVRDVAPKKMMMCATFVLPEGVGRGHVADATASGATTAGAGSAGAGAGAAAGAGSGGGTDDVAAAPAGKRQRTEE